MEYLPKEFMKNPTACVYVGQKKKNCIMKMIVVKITNKEKLINLEMSF